MAKRFGLGHRVDELSAALAGKELYFSSPPLDGDLIRAIKAITPQFSLRADETSRRVWELSQNGSSWAEYEALRPVLDDLPQPARVLEIGPGMGRSVVFFRSDSAGRRPPSTSMRATARRGSTRSTHRARRALSAAT